MSIEANKTTVRRFVEMLDTNDLEALGDVLSPELAHALRGGIKTNGEHNVKITDIVAEGDKVVAVMASSGVHAGDFEGIPAAGKSWTNTGATVFRLENGKIVDITNFFDGLVVLHQLRTTMTSPA